MDGLPQDGYTPSPIRLGPVIVVTSPPETSSSGSLGNMVPLSVLSRSGRVHGRGRGPRCLVFASSGGLAVDLISGSTTA